MKYSSLSAWSGGLSLIPQEERIGRERRRTTSATNSRHPSCSLPKSTVGYAREKKFFVPRVPSEDAVGGWHPFEKTVGRGEILILAIGGRIEVESLRVCVAGRGGRGGSILATLCWAIDHHVKRRYNTSTRTSIYFVSHTGIDWSATFLYSVCCLLL